jgi:hypothetical protein
MRFVTFGTFTIRIDRIESIEPLDSATIITATSGTNTVVQLPHTEVLEILRNAA